MTIQNNDELSESFGGSETEKLQLENELLKLKMQAEYGAHFGRFADSPDMSPELERAFLEQVLAFERLYENSKPVPVREYLGNPVFRPAAELDADELNAEWKRLTDLYASKELGVDFIADYPLSTMYDFMAGELLNEEIEPIPGWCFIYEEFHPNHDHDQRRRTQRFMDEFFGGTFCEDTLSDELVTQDGRRFRLEQVQALLERFHGVFERIESWEYAVIETSAQTDEELAAGPPRMPRLGFSEGLLRYTIVMPGGERKLIEGPFKLYMECHCGWWSVMSFCMHGFSWEGGDAV